MPIQGNATDDKDYPNANHEQVDGDLTGRSDRMTHPHADKHMMQMCLVGMEGALAVNNTHEHHPDSVEDGDAEDSQGQGNQVGVVAKEGLPKGNIAIQQGDDKPREEHAHHHGTRIADEHTAAVAKHIMEKERHEGGDHNKSQNGVNQIASQQERQAKQNAATDAKPTAQPIDTVNHIDGVDDAHAAKNGKRYGNPPIEAFNTPKTMTRIDAETRGKNQSQ